ncbi:MAG: hypothetical protein WCI43_00630 [Candidatus Firestonebacteria bacterium]
MYNKSLVNTAKIVLGTAMVFAGYPSIKLIFELVGYFGLGYVGLLVLSIGLLVMLDLRSISRAIKLVLQALLLLLVCLFLYVVIREGWWSLMGFVGVLLISGGVHIIMETLNDMLKNDPARNIYQNSFEELLSLLMILTGALISLGIIVIFLVDTAKKRPIFEYINIDSLIGPMLIAGGLILMLPSQIFEAISGEEAEGKKQTRGKNAPAGEKRKPGKRTSGWNL